MNLGFFISRLGENLQVVEGLVNGLSEAQARWKPSPDRWSILEVVNHLYDEEREDFRVRLDITLHSKGVTWPRIDPQLWVVERRYNERDLIESFQEFVRERERSLAWLRELSDPNWQASYQHSRGLLNAGDILASWLAHDFLHIRQITRLHYEYVQLVAAPFQTDYAGDWPSAG
jgi:hypothetical protein